MVVKGEVDVEMKVEVLLEEVVLLPVEEGVMEALPVEEGEEEEVVVLLEGAEVEEGEAKAGMGWFLQTSLSLIFLQKMCRGGYMMVSNWIVQTFQSWLQIPCMCQFVSSINFGKTTEIF